MRAGNIFPSKQIQPIFLMTYTNRNKGSKMNDFMISNETENTPDVDNNMRIVFSVLKSQMDVQCAGIIQTKPITKEQLQMCVRDHNSFHFNIECMIVAVD